MHVPMPLRRALALAALVAATAATAQQRAVVVVRHAELQGTMAQPPDAPLSDEGAARAERLAQMLRASGVTAIFTTEFVRTKKTAEPLAREARVEPVVVPKAESASLPERVRRDGGNGTVVVVGHSDTLPALLKALGYPGEVRIDATDFGNVFVGVPTAETAAGQLRWVLLRY